MIADRTLVCGTVGLGYVGLPLAVEKAKAGFKTIGFDVQAEKVAMVNRGENYIGDVVQEDLAALVAAGTLEATCDFSRIAECGFVAICVPRRSTPTRCPTPPTWRRPRARSRPTSRKAAWWCSSPPPTPAPPRS